MLTTFLQALTPSAVTIENWGRFVGFMGLASIFVIVVALFLDFGIDWIVKRWNARNYQIDRPVPVALEDPRRRRELQAATGKVGAPWKL